MKYIFGPVPSRRLGLSLGVDLVPQKLCSLNCLYCECGKTPDSGLVIHRDEYILMDDILSELDEYLLPGPELDYITLTGSGEPTLNSRIGDIIQYLKQKYPRYKLALLTNGTLLWDTKVQEEILPVDLIVPSLDAVSDNIFDKINKPEPGLDNNKIINGIIEFRKKYRGVFWLEVFIVPGINDGIEELGLLKEKIDLINPDKVHLNALDRPPAFDNVKKPPLEKLEEIRDFFLPHRTDIIAKYTGSTKSKNVDLNKAVDKVRVQVLGVLKRRPSTLEDLSHTLDIDEDIIKPYIEKMLSENKIKSLTLDRGEFYSIAD